MANYLIIESREPDESFEGDTDFTDWVHGLRAQGHDITLFLTQNAVIAARRGCVFNAALDGLLAKEVKVVVDEFNATEKSIDALSDGLELANMDQIMDQIMTPGTRTVWH